MPTIVKDQSLVFADFPLVTPEATTPLRAHISGPLAQLHRFTEAAEKALATLGAYDRLTDTDYPWPDKDADSIVDLATARLFIDEALLLYHTDLIGDASAGRGTITAVSGKKNRITSSSVSYKDNGDSYPRSALFLDRDVAIGDRVYLRGVTDPADDCVEIELWTYVDGFASEAIAGNLADCAPDVNNQDNTQAAASILQTGGAINCVEATIDGTAYDGMADGYVTETYTIEVVKSSVAGCTAARLRVTSASGTDDADEVEPSAFGDPTAIGSRGLLVTFDDATGACSASADSTGVSENEFVVGQIWEATVSQDFERACCESGGSYDGEDDDTYIVEVTQGGLWADEPQITVTTVKGLDFSGPTTVTDAYTEIPVGSHGLTIQFVDCFGADAASASLEGEPFGGDSALAGLRAGDRFYIEVDGTANGPIRTLILRHDVPELLRDAADLDLRLFIAKPYIEVTENRLSAPPAVNYSLSAMEIHVEAGITAYDATWTDDGVEQPLTVYAGTLYIDYREWLLPSETIINTISSTDDIDDVPGQLDPANPLKWAIYKALQNSNDNDVAYTAVADPDDTDSWRTVLDALVARPEIYNMVPLTYTRAVLDLYKAHVLASSTPESGAWQALLVNITVPADVMLVGEGATTSTDGELVLATVEDDPDADGTQYTILSVPAANSGFITYHAAAGDIIRYLFTVDAFGTHTYQEFVVDEVISENSVRLLAGPNHAISVPQKIELWHRQSKDQLVTAIAAEAATWNSSRVLATWPDLAGSSGLNAGYFLNAALAGLMSAMVPQQAMTNISISGFDDLASRARDFFTAAQLDALAAGGVLVVTEDQNGTPYTRNGYTTDATDADTRSEVARRNLDSISYQFLDRLLPFVGRANVTQDLLNQLEHEINQEIIDLRTAAATSATGAQLVSGEIHQNPDGTLALIQHPLFADHVQIVLDLVPTTGSPVTLNLVV